MALLSFGHDPDPRTTNPNVPGHSTPRHPYVPPPKEQKLGSTKQENSRYTINMDKQLSIRLGTGGWIIIVVIFLFICRSC